MIVDWFSPAVSAVLFSCLLPQQARAQLCEAACSLALPAEQA